APLRGLALGAPAAARRERGRPGLAPLGPQARARDAPAARAARRLRRQRARDGARRARGRCARARARPALLHAPARRPRRDPALRRGAAGGRRRRGRRLPRPPAALPARSRGRAVPKRPRPPVGGGPRARRRGGGGNARGARRRAARGRGPAARLRPRDARGRCAARPRTRDARGRRPGGGAMSTARARRLRAAAAAAALLAASACAGLAGPGPDAQRACWPRFPYQDGWLGADGAYSVPLSATRSVWLFGDTFVGRPGQPDRVGAVLVHNSIGVSECRNGRFSIRYAWGADPDGTPRAFLARPGGRGWWWLFGGIVHDGALWIGLLEVEPTAPRGPLAIPFRHTGTALARIANPHAEPPRRRAA